MHGRIKVALAMALLATSMAGCVDVRAFKTDYPAPVAVEVSRGWHVVGVKVNVPRTLSVSEDPVLLPKADIVWREDPLGDRYEQVGKIVQRGVELGSRDLHGKRGVRLELTVSRFHAMTFEAESLNYNVGVHNIGFSMEVVDASTGKVLAGPEIIDADFPAMTGPRMIEARLRGESQKSQIVAHIAAVISGWLGTGPDVRKTFLRAGG